MSSSGELMIRRFPSGTAVTFTPVTRQSRCRHSAPPRASLHLALQLRRSPPGRRLQSDSRRLRAKAPPAVPQFCWLTLNSKGIEPAPTCCPAAGGNAGFAPETCEHAGVTSALLLGRHQNRQVCALRTSGTGPDPAGESRIWSAAQDSVDPRPGPGSGSSTTETKAQPGGSEL